jgi:hypothetical protein
MFRRLVLTLAVAAVAAFSAETYKITLFQPSVVKGVDLKAGDYRIQLNDQKVVLIDGKKHIDLAATVETGDKKYSTTMVRYADQGGKSAIAEIRLGGTKTRLVFNQ